MSFAGSAAGYGAIGGAAVGAGYSAVSQYLDCGEIDWGEVGHSGIQGMFFGAAFALAEIRVAGYILGRMAASTAARGGAGSLALNLGSGTNPMAGAINVDIRAVAGVDVVASASNLPFRPGVFTEVHAINPFGFNPVSAETARVMAPGALLRVTGTPRNGFAQPVSATQAREAGFDVVGSGPMSSMHQFGVQSATTGGTLNTVNSTTTTYRRIPGG